MRCAAAVQLAGQARHPRPGPLPQPTLARDAMPTAPSSLTSPSASTRTPSAHLAASTREILPLNLGAAWPMREAW